MARKHISWKTKCASALMLWARFPYNDAKQMTEDQFLSLWQWDHNILYSSEHEDRDKWWNLAPMYISAHREKTKQDAKIIAKSRRIRVRLAKSSNEIHAVLLSPEQALAAWAEEKRARTLRSRGFDKTKTRGFDGKVRPRKK